MTHRVVVIVPPEPVVTPADVPGSHAADDATVAALIAVATAEIDGPTGWLGRAIGPQMLEWRFNDWGPLSCATIPYPPIIEIASVVYLDEDDQPVLIPAEDYALAGQMIYTKPTFTAPSPGPPYEGVRVRYMAGYDGSLLGSPPIGTTGDVPAPIKQWIILRATQLLGMLAADPMVRSETTVDLDSVTYATPGADTGFDVLFASLLSPYKVYY